MQFREFISLGTQCQVAHSLKLAGLRNAAFPFDWIVTPEWSAYAAIEDDFRDFFRLDSLRPIRNDPRVFSVINRYGCIFQHEFHGLPTEETMAPHLARLQRRIQRFREVCTGPERVLFVRKKVGPYEARCLRDLIAGRFPSLEFQLLCVNERAEDWRLDRIHNRQALITHSTDELNDVCCNAWVEMLKEFSSG